MSLRKRGYVSEILEQSGTDLVKFVEETAELVAKEAAQHMADVFEKVMKKNDINDIRFLNTLSSWEDRTRGNGKFYKAIIDPLKHYMVDTAQKALSGDKSAIVDLGDEDEVIRVVLKPAVESVFKTLGVRLGGFGPNSYFLRLKKMDKLTWAEILSRRFVAATKILKERGISGAKTNEEVDVVMESAEQRARKMSLDFSRMDLKEIMKEVKRRVPADVIKSAWVWSGLKGTWEFHIGKGKEQRIVWHGQAGGAADARARGWEAYLS